MALFVRIVAVAGAVVALAGCKKPGAPTPAPGEPSAIASAFARKAIDVDGLHAEQLAGGRITVTGTDQWGGKIDTTYENATFFRNALPTLSRSVTPAQAAALQKLAAELNDASE